MATKKAAKKAKSVLKTTHDQVLQEKKQIEEQLQKAVHDLASRDSEIRRLRAELEAAKQAGTRAKLQFDGTHRETQRLAERIAEYKRERDIAYAARDENARLFADMREKVFELEVGIESRIAEAEGLAMFYKERLKKVLRAVKEAGEGLH